MRDHKKNMQTSLELFITVYFVQSFIQKLNIYIPLFVWKLNVYIALFVWKLNVYIALFQVRLRSFEKRLFTSSYPSVCLPVQLSVCFSATPSGRIFMKFHTGQILLVWQNCLAVCIKK